MSVFAIEFRAKKPLTMPKSNSLIQNELSSKSLGKPRIAFVSQPEYFRFMYETDLEEFAEVKEFNLAHLLNTGNFSSLLDFDADFNFFFRGEFFPALLLKRLRGKKIALSSEPFPRRLSSQLEFTRDSIKRYMDFRRGIRSKEFDFVFHYDEASLGFMEKDGLRLSGAFPFPVATDIYAPSSTQKIRDLFFIGRSTRHRERYFGQLKHRFNFLHICHGLFGPPLVGYISESKICLNVHAEDETSWEPRMQMLLAIGAFVISEPITPNSIIRPGIEFIEATSPADMNEKVAYFLEHADEREEIANQGRSRVRALLSSRGNFARLISELEANSIPKYKHSGPSPLMRTIDYYFQMESAISRFRNRVFRYLRQKR